MKIGLLGGTFNPVHRGHLMIAEGALDALGLQEVWWIPAAHPPLKSVEDDVSIEHRMKMVELAIQSHPAFKISRLEMNRPGPSYTVDTLRELKRLHPDDEWFFITGSDVLPELPRWKNIDEALKLATFVTVLRPNAQRKMPGRVRLLNVPTVDVSSSEIRRRIHNRQSIEGLVPQAVASYIKENHLYA